MLQNIRLACKAIKKWRETDEKGETREDFKAKK